MAHEKGQTQEQAMPRELPEGQPMPHEANPGGIEGAEPGWPGGTSNLGEILNPEPEGDGCGQAFHTVELLNVHRRTAHRLSR